MCLACLPASAAPDTSVAGRGLVSCEKRARGNEGSLCRTTTTTTTTMTTTGASRATGLEVSVEDLVDMCRGDCPVSKLQSQMQHELATLQREVERVQSMQHELQANNDDVLRVKMQLEKELAALVDKRNVLQRVYKHRDGRLKRRWVVLCLTVGATGAYYWWRGDRATTFIGRQWLSAVDWFHAWRDHASAVSDDMTVMGPFIHAAADFVRLVSTSASVAHPF
mmetsp:Transcript_128950/g.360810  ORF Transcript_128950/g.360810 Transcript_128950/m.360810 type:complete len:223 (+) Transcript_128950:80-748(+)